VLDLKDLHCFVAVYDTRGFARAAAKLNTVQSNVSARIRKLEDNAGVALFERLHRAIRPTPQGEIMYRYAKKVLADVSSLEDAVRGRDVA
jgi:DNA-binding transcriptional LysR family regulator